MKAWRVGEATPRNRLPFVALLSARIISVIGDTVATVAIPWFVLQTTGSATKTGLAAAVTVLPMVLAGVFGGTLVDRVGLKQTSIIADVTSGVTIALIPLLHHTVGLTYWQLLLLAFLGALLDAPGRSARAGLMPDVAEAADIRLERANSAFGSARNAANLIGPLLAGVLVAALGPSNVLWVDAATFAISAALIAVAVPSSSRCSEQPNRRGSYFTELRAGVRFLGQQQLILALIVIAALVNFVLSPLYSVVLPVYADQVFGSPVSLGLMFASFGGGELVGTVLYGVMAHRLPRWATFTGAFLVTAIPLAALALLPDLPITVLFLATAGFALGPTNPILDTLFQERTPPQMRGRVFGLLNAVASAATPVGMLGMGFLLESASLRITLVVAATAFFTVTLSLLVNSNLREMDTTTPTSPRVPG